MRVRQERRRKNIEKITITINSKIETTVSLQFNTAPNESSEDGINKMAAGTINNKTMGGTTTAGQGRTPQRLRFNLEPHVCKQ